MKITVNKTQLVSLHATNKKESDKLMSFYLGKQPVREERGGIKYVPAVEKSTLGGNRGNPWKGKRKKPCPEGCGKMLYSFTNHLRNTHGIQAKKRRKNQHRKEKEFCLICRKHFWNLITHNRLKHGFGQKENRNEGNRGSTAEGGERVQSATFSGSRLG